MRLAKIDRQGFFADIHLMKRVAIYIRVSTLNQSTDLQKSELTEYCQHRGWHIVGIYEDKLTGRNTQRPQFQEVLKMAGQRKIDIFAVWKLDRAFRSLKDTVTVLHDLNELGVEFVSLKDANLDMTTASGRLMIHMISAFAAFEADMIRMRVKAGLDHAKANGVKLGRPLSVDKEKVVELGRQGMSIRKIAKELGIGKSTVQKILTIKPSK